MLEELLEAFCQLSSCRSIVDLGCGKGRVMVVAAYFGFTSIKGIDFAKELCREASSNMRKTEANIPSMQWEVINADVLDYTILPEDKVFFMFNPFVEEILVVFLDRLEKSCQQFHRKIYFLYASPQHAAVLLDRGFKVIFQQSIMNMYGLILVKH
jgi:SAM-dependent methyltransferase